MNNVIRSVRVQTILSVILGTGYLTLLISLSQHGSWIGYGTGFGDHNVLMPQGIQWAIPDAFLNDWFVSAAPQPHWFFDIIVSFGVTTGTIDYLLLVYWLIGLAAFTLATVLLAQMIVSRFSFLATLLMLTIAGVAPWGLFGTGTGTIGMALPTVLAGNLIYLVIVLLLRKNSVAAATIGAIVAIVHVQQGAIIAVIFAATIVGQWVANRKIPWHLLIGLALNIGFVIFGLKLRPVAANPGDFVEVCNTVIPYHCAVWMWHWPVLAAAIGGCLAGIFTYLAMKAEQRLMWATTIGLVILGYLGGLLCDALRIPVLGELAQSVNANRLGSIVVPFMLWGLLLPLLKIQGFEKFRRRAGAPWMLYGVWAAVTGMALIDPAWGVIYVLLDHRVLTLSIAALALLCFVVGVLWKRSLLPWIPAFAVTIMCVLAAIFAGTVQPKPTFNWYSEHLSDSVSHEWFRAVGQVVPAGEVITAPGSSDTMKLYSQRATIVDCKNVPYGGDAWTEWKQRTSDLGIDCKDNFEYGPEMDLIDLTDLAKKYDSRFLVLDQEFIMKHSEEIADSPWKLVLEPRAGVDWTLYELAD